MGAIMEAWSFEADYFTACNCDWGCPCNFNAPPNGGSCRGWGVWQIRNGRFRDTELAGTSFAVYYDFPGPIENGNGAACTYIGSSAGPEQRDALDAIACGKAGGGIFQLFGEQLVTSWLPTKFVPIEFKVVDGVGRIRIGDIGEAESELLSYPDGSTIRPTLVLPHGLEYKTGLMTNTRRWGWRDGRLSASYENRYGAVARVKFSSEGCVG